jgi:anti-sigma B factor antagonist
MRPVVTDPDFELTTDADGVIARVTGCTALTEQNVAAFGRLLNGAAEGCTGKHLRLDLAAIEFLTSVVLAKLIGVNGRFRTAGGKLTLLNVNPDVREVFAVTKLDHIFHVVPAA